MSGVCGLKDVQDYAQSGHTSTVNTATMPKMYSPTFDNEINTGNLI
jgi:hypothetical protein